MKEVKEIIKEDGEVTLNLRSGEKKVVPAKTIYTYYTDGTNDCRIEIQKPLDIKGNQQEVK